MLPLRFCVRGLGSCTPGGGIFGVDGGSGAMIIIYVGAIIVIGAGNARSG